MLIQIMIQMTKLIAKKSQKNLIKMILRKTWLQMLTKTLRNLKN